MHEFQTFKTGITSSLEVRKNTVLQPRSKYMPLLRPKSNSNTKAKCKTPLTTVKKEDKT